MKTKSWAIGLVVVSTLIISFAQILWKMASSKLSLNVIELVMNWQLILGFVLYAIAAAALIFALKHGELSVLYPFVGASFVWVSLLSMWMLGEGMNVFKWSGVVFIILGLSFIGYGSKG